MIEKDSATTEFCVIRVVFSIVSMFKFPMATIKVKHAYLQGGTLPRAIYIQPGEAEPYFCILHRNPFVQHMALLSLKVSGVLQS